jgi:hypothetical protein
MGVNYEILQLILGCSIARAVPLGCVFIVGH